MAVGVGVGVGVGVAVVVGVGVGVGVGAGAGTRAASAVAVLSASDRSCRLDRIGSPPPTRMICLLEVPSTTRVGNRVVVPNRLSALTAVASFVTEAPRSGTLVREP